MKTWLRRRTKGRVAMWAWFAVAFCMLWLMIDQIIFGPAYILAGKNKVEEYYAVIGALITNVELTKFTPNNLWYRHEKHAWIFEYSHGDRGSVPEYGAGDIVERESFFFFGRQKWMHASVITGTLYWMAIPGPIPIGTCASLAGIWCLRRGKIKGVGSL